MPHRQRGRAHRALSGTHTIALVEGVGDHYATASGESALARRTKARARKALEAVTGPANPAAGDASAPAHAEGVPIRDGRGVGLLARPRVASTVDTPTAFDTEPSRYLYSKLYRILSGRSRMRAARWFNHALALLIFVNVGAFVVASIDSVANKYSGAFYGLEAFSSCAFMIEHIARVYVSPESRKARLKHEPAWVARLRYSLRFRALVDLCSCLPFFIELMARQGLPTLTWLKVLRIFRVMKTERYVRAFGSIARVVYFNSEILLTALFIGLVLMLSTATLLWYLAPPGDTQDDFSSIPSTFYLSILMLTGQGTPATPLPWYTKVIVMCTAVVSVPIFVIPSSMLTWGFEAEAERLMRRKRERRRRRKRAKQRLAAAATNTPPAMASVESSSSSSSGDDSGDPLDFSESDKDDEAEYDEYEAVVLGSDDEDEAGGEDEDAKADRELRKRLVDFFAVADKDGSGSLSIAEFYRYARQMQDRQREAGGDGGGGGGGGDDMTGGASASGGTHEAGYLAVAGGSEASGGGAAASPSRASAPSKATRRPWDGRGASVVEDGSLAPSAATQVALARIEARLDQLADTVEKLAGRTP